MGRVPAARTLAVGAAGGLAYVLFVLSGWLLHPSGPRSVRSMLEWAPWFSIGTVYVVSGWLVTGGTLALLFEKYRLVSPIVAVGVIVSSTWYFQGRGEYVLPPDPWLLFLFGWPLVVGIALYVGGVEKIFVRPFA